MNNNNFKEQLAKIKNAYNIVDVISEENVSLKQVGPGSYMALCPFHSEKTPSFRVNEDFQNYRCFGCGAHGDIFSFIEENRGCSFKEAVLYLANLKNIEIDFGASDSDSTDYPKIDIKTLYNLLKDSYQFYRSEYDKLPLSHPAKKEVSQRGLDVNNPVFCYAPERYGALFDYLTEKGYSKETMLQSTLIAESNGKYYDFFHSRLMITLSDFSGRPVSYSARKLFETDTRAKYVNGKQSPVFQKKSTLFNLNNAKKCIRESKQVIVCEGPFDVLSLEKSGIHNAVASCGTAFTEEQLRNLEQIVGIDGDIIFSFDGDDAGIAAAVKTFLHFPLIHGNSSVVLFPEGLDPCDYLMKYGPEKMSIPFEHKTPIIDFVVNAVAKKMNLSDMQSRYKFSRLLMQKYTSAVTDKVLRDYMIRRVSVLSGIQIEALIKMIKEPRKQNNEILQKNTNTSSEKSNSEIVINNDDVDPCFVTAFAMLIRFPSFLFPKLKDFKIPKKYNDFLHELANNCHKYYLAKKPIRIIPEQYNCPNFVKLLQSTEVMVDYSNKDEIEKHFINTLKIGDLNLKSQEKQKEKAAITQALEEAKTNDEIIKLLALAEKKFKN